MRTHESQSPASIVSRNFLEPLALVRSPMMRKLASWWNGTALNIDAAPTSGRGSRRAGVRSLATAASRRRCSGVEPQQPPTTCTPSSVMNRVWYSTNSSGERS